MTGSVSSLRDVLEKRRVLVVEDEAINREILGFVLEQEYEVLYAEDGEEALNMIREYREVLSIILLDLIMPKLQGLEVLRIIKEDPATRHIPVIVLSADQTREIDCLNAGASDFIQKPYPDSGVVLARVLRTIELQEDRRIIRSTERDPLTGLYNREYFYSYAQQFDQYHKDMDMDAIVLDIDHFSILNERHGRAYADDVLRRVGEKAREMVHESGGIVCRRSADIFMVYCPHREDYKAILDMASTGLAGEDHPNHMVRLRMGVYSRVDKTLDMERRFDRAKTAADSVRGSFTRNIGVYDDTLHKADLYSEQLIEDFPAAIREKQFKVFYQPKYDIRSDIPFLNSAEALIRWEHPDLGMISPGVFIPLFEENGLIQELDRYVWREAARQVHEWKEELEYSIPVSVNVSRVDMYDPSLTYVLQELLTQNSLAPSELHLEVTESAYTEDSQQIIEMVKKLRLMGHEIEMDDFGTGYSSLNMLSEIPIDALKLDMKFIRTAFAGERDTHMIEVILGIANHLHVPVIAEGVETKEQLETLQELGCDIVQGYFFSPPVPPEKFLPFLEERKRLEEERAKEAEAGSRQRRREKRKGEKEKGLFEKLSSRFGTSVRKTVRVASLSAVLIGALLFIADAFVNQGYSRMVAASDQYIVSQQASTAMEKGSDYLTEKVRNFVVTGELSYLEDYFEEADVTKRRDNAVKSLENLMGDSQSQAYMHLSTALDYSNELMEYEYKAMKLTLENGSYDEMRIPQVLKDLELSEAEKSLSEKEKAAMATELVFGKEYQEYKNSIMEHTALCTEEMLHQSELEQTQAERRLRFLLAIQTFLTILFIVIVLMMVLYLIIWIRTPLLEIVKRMKARKEAAPVGAEELRYVAGTYNEIHDENLRVHERLSYGATHDALTGLLNRSAYDLMSKDIEAGRNALVLVDVDRFKSVNDTYGHAVGDMILKSVAESLLKLFRMEDQVFRLGGDEFVVIMGQADSSMRETVKNIIDQINTMLQHPKGDLPAASLSVGVAFTDREKPEGDIFKDADTALYRVKSAGRCGCEVF